MKKAILAVSILVASFGASSRGLTMEDCLEYSKAAKNIMELRQSGFDMGELMKIVIKPEFESERKVLTQMVKGAYEIPKFSGDKYVQEMISEYGNEWMITCIEFMD